MLSETKLKEEVKRRVNERMVHIAYRDEGTKGLCLPDNSCHVKSLIKIGHHDSESPIYVNVFDEIPINEIYNNSLNSPTIGGLNVFRCKAHIFYSISSPKTDFVDKFKQLSLSVDKILSEHKNLKTTSQLTILEVRIDEDSQPWMVSIIALYDPEMYLKVLVDSACTEGITSRYYDAGKPVYEEVRDEQ